MKNFFTFFFCVITMFVCAQQPMLDPSFGVNGIAITNFIDSTDDYINAMVVQPDQKILVLGNYSSGNNDDRVSVVRFHPNGSIDSSFADYGKFSHAFTDYGDALMRSIALQPDGKIVLGGRYSGGLYSSGLARLNTDGTFDSTFAMNGTGLYYFGGMSEGDGLYIQPDGKILLSSFLGGGVIRMMIMRTNADGSIDSSFGTGGFNTLAVNYSPGKKIGLQSNGDIIVGGHVGSTPLDFIVARFNSSGLTDSTFGFNGFRQLDINGLDECRALAIQPDDKILIGGNGKITTDENFELVRLLPDGEIDSTFGNSGKIILNLLNGVSTERITHVAHLPDGKILCGGYCIQGNLKYFTLFRFAPNGTLDSSFASSGIDTIRYDALISASNFDITSDGSILIAGDEQVPSMFGFSMNKDMHLMKVDSLGSLDTTFAINGHVSTGINHAEDWVNGMVVESNGKIILCGWSSRRGGEYHSSIARYQINGLLDTTFGNNAGLDTLLNFIRPTIALDQNGKLILAGDASAGLVVARLNNDGSRDSTFGTSGSTAISIPGYSHTLVTGLEIQSDGKIVFSSYIQDSSFDYHTFLCRLHTDGSLDSSYGLAGSIIFPDTIYGKYIRIVTGDKVLLGPRFAKADFFLLNNDGSYDTSFTFNRASLPSNLTVYDFAIQPDSKILSIGQSGQTMYVFRILMDGNFDPSFGINGVDSIDFPLMSRLIVFPDNSSLAAGFNGLFPNGYQIIKLQENGAPDSAWGANGIASLYVIENFYRNETQPIFIELLPDQKILMAQTFRPAWPIESYNFSVVRIQTGLSLDLNKPAIEKQSSFASIYPNPVTTNDVKFSYSVACPGQVFISVKDRLGKVITTQSVNVQASGVFKDRIKIPTMTTTGLYFLEISTACGYGVLKFQFIRQ